MPSARRKWRRRQRFTIGIADMPEQEADELLDLLFEHQLKMDFQYHHKWHDNDVVMWDNRCLLHRAGGVYHYPEIRLLHKTVVAGDKPH